MLYKLSEGSRLIATKRVVNVVGRGRWHSELSILEAGTKRVPCLQRI